MIATQGHARHPGIPPPHARHYQIESGWRRPAEPGYEQCMPLRAQMELPRPLEPRHERTPSIQDPRRDFGPGPQLPGVRDILSPPSDTEAWRQTPHQYFPAPQYHSHGLQPPPSYPNPERRFELPVLETRGPSAALPPSPYGPTHSEREYSEATYNRPRQQSARDSVSSPYTPAYDENTHHNNYERAGPIYTHTPSSNGRYLGIQEYAEGQFHVYDDGSKLPTQIDGEHVNPQWGVTKANKPRKRLALACLDCREKKVRCEPGATACLQCEKAKRPCRRDKVNHSQHDASSTTEWSSNAGSPPARSGAAEATPPGSRHADEPAKRRAPEELSVDSLAVKRQKSTSPASLQHITNTLPPPMPMANGSHILSDETDPYAVNPIPTMRLLDLYFQHINSGVYSIFPKDAFLRWVTGSTNKSHADRMVIYAMMAMGAIFDKQNYQQLGEHCAALTLAALNNKLGKFSLHLVHMKLILALYNFALGKSGIGWELCGAAMRNISALRFNNEEGCSTETERDPVTKEYGLSYHQAIECRRRTFWCGFMMDRLYGFNESMSCTVQKADIYLRLPCVESTYEKGSRSQAPYFDNGMVDRTDATFNSNAPVALMAHLALVTSIWGDAMHHVYQNVNRSSSGHAAAYEAFYADTYNALQTWQSRLPPHLQYNEENLLRSIRDRYVGDFVTMHVLFHYALLKMNRCMRWSLMPDKVTRNICEAHTHAHQLLSIVKALTTAKIDYNVIPYAHRWGFSTPFIGFAIISAIDVISAGGPDSTLKAALSIMQESLVFLRELAQHWDSAVEQAKSGETRYLQLKNVTIRPYKAKGGCWLGRKWGLEEPLEKELDLKDDCIYGVDHGDYYDALEALDSRQGTS